MAHDYYSVLKAPRDADQAELKRAYRGQAKIHHPDRNDGDDKQFKAIKKAYDFLCDPKKRQQYDRLLDLKESGELDRIMQRKRFERVPFVSMEPPEPEPAPAPEPEAEPAYDFDGAGYDQARTYRVPRDAHLYPEIAGWWVPVPPNDRPGYIANPYHDPALAAARTGAPKPLSRGLAVVAEVLDLLRKKRW